MKKHKLPFLTINDLSAGTLLLAQNYSINWPTAVRHWPKHCRKSNPPSHEKILARLSSGAG
jgi:hypothetical protein